MQTGIRSRVKEAVHHLKPVRDEDGHLRPRSLSFLHRHESRDAKDLDEAFGKRSDQAQAQDRPNVNTSQPHKSVGDQDGSETLHPSADLGDPHHQPGPHGASNSPQSRANPGLIFDRLEARDATRTDGKGPTTLASCNTPLELYADKEKIVVDTQIQLYATNAQLCHPWVSPILGYMGGLPPLLICAGDNEVLRDEITYL